MASVILFCEGEVGSLDILAFKKLLGQLSGVTLVPVGGKFNSTAFVDGYLRRGGNGGVLNPKSVAYFLRDRDFDFPVPLSPELVNLKKNGGIENNVSIYASYRTTLENYLIAAPLLQEYLQSRPNPPQIDVQKLIDEAARSILHYSTIRHALGKIRGHVSLDTTWMKQGSGTLPEKAVLTSLEECSLKAKEMINTYQNESTSISEAHFDQSVALFSTQFTAPQFWEEREYFVYFQGKDLEKAITIHLNNLHVQISWSDYYRFAIDRIDFLQFPDYNQFYQLLVDATIP